MLCPVCNINSTTRHPIYGMLPCLECKGRRDGLKSPDHLIEFTSPDIKKQRRQFDKDIIQPYRGNEASKEFIDAYPNKAKEMFTEKEIKNARNVWK